MSHRLVVLAALAAIVLGTQSNAAEEPKVEPGAEPQKAEQAVEEQPEPWDHVEWGFVAGRVVDRAGKGVKNVLVEVWTPNEMVMNATTGDNGWFELHPRPIGSYRVRLVGPAGGTQELPGLTVYEGVNAQANLLFVPTGNVDQKRQARTPPPRPVAPPKNVQPPPRQRDVMPEPGL